MNIAILVFIYLSAIGLFSWFMWNIAKSFYYNSERFGK